MFLLFLSLISSKKPVVLIPGTYASLLQMTGKDLGHEWFCPKTLDNQIIWVDEMYLIPPILDCFFQWLKIYYDPVKNVQLSHPNSIIDIVDFGSLRGVTSVDSFIQNISIIPYYTFMINYFEKNGYVEGKDLFGAPIDWRMGLAQAPTVFYPRLIKLIEDIYAKTNEKVVIIGHSFGGFVVQNFLAEGATQEWIDKYIDHGIALAPSFGGSIEAMQISYTKVITKGITIKNKYLAETLETMGAVHVHYMNYELYEDDIVFYGPDGDTYNAKDFPDLLVKHEKITGDGIPLLKLNEPYFATFPKQTKAPLQIIFNSGRETRTAIKVNSWDNETVENVYGKGDGTIISDGLNKYCNKYSSNTRCHDLNEDGFFGSHLMMLYHYPLIELTYKAVTNSTLF